MEEKLARYRSKKRREEFMNHFKDKLKSTFSFRTASNMNNYNIENSEQFVNLLSTSEKETIENVDDEEDDDIDDTSIKCCSYPTLIYYTLCFILWVVVYSIFITLQFGTVYLLLSGVLGMYFNTRTGPKPKNEISAYSVFNKNCVSIDGTLKAEQFEREIRYGPSSVR